MRKHAFTLALVSAVFLAGCATAPSTMSGSFDLPPRLPEDAYQRIVVSDFTYRTSYSEERMVGQGYNVTYWQIYTESGSGDMSAQMARFLNEMGVEARAMKEFGFRQLGKGELLLTGNIVFEETNNVTIPRVMLFFLMIGNVLPTPFPFESGSKGRYSYELIAPDGSIVYQTETRSMTVAYRHYWIWGHLAARKNDFYRAADVINTQFFDEISALF